MSSSDSSTTAFRFSVSTSFPPAVPSISMTIEFVALGFTLSAILASVANIAYMAYKLSCSQTRTLYGFLVLSIISLSVQLSLFSINYFHVYLPVVILLNWLIGASGLMFLLLSVNFLNGFTKTGQISSRTVRGLKVFAVMAHVVLAGPLYLRGILFLNSKDAHWAALWYRTTVSFWYLFLIVFDFVQGIWVARTLWLHIKNMQLLQIRTMTSTTQSVPAVIVNSTHSPTTPVNHSSSLDTLAPSMHALKPATTKKSARRAPKIDPHLIVRKAYHFAIFCCVGFFLLDLGAIALFGLSGAFESDYGTVSQRFSTAYAQMAIANVTAHFIAATLYFENLKAMMAARTKIHSTGTTSSGGHTTVIMSPTDAKSPTTAAMSMSPLPPPPQAAGAGLHAPYMGQPDATYGRDAENQFFQSDTTDFTDYYQYSSSASQSQAASAAAAAEKKKAKQKLALTLQHTPHYAF
ncbi:hypothetical protein BC831DRAFT_477844 [Entophlyctis helioformis]|nr:hypothetical protein BC831DRAFT_477844 [Entophlyctis helioformis]